LIKFNKNSSEKTQQEKDLELANHDGLFDEYLEMGKIRIFNISKYFQ
jgi:hypothetical protein